MKRSMWFAGGVRPARSGVYEVRWYVYTMQCGPIVRTGYAYWSRRRGWRNVGATPKEAMQRAHYSHPVVGPEWRGLVRTALAGRQQL